MRTSDKISLEGKLPCDGYLPHMWRLHKLVWHLFRIFASLIKWTSYVTFIQGIRPKILFY